MDDSYEPRVTELPNAGWDPRVRVFRVPNEVDTSVVVTNRYLVIIDTMTTPEQITAVMRLIADELPSRQLLVINTHADYDHAWGNAVFASPVGAFPAPIIAGAATDARLRSELERLYLNERRKDEPALANVLLVPPTIAVSGPCTIDGGDLSLVLIPTPGHTPDHMSVWLPDIRLLLAGDAAELPYPYCGADADIDVMLSSLDALRNLKPTVVIPCHGGTTSPDLLDRNIAYFQKLDVLVRAAIAGETIPPDWERSSAIGDAIAYPFEKSVRDQGADPSANGDFYRTAHLLAIRATIRRVVGGGQAL